MTKTKDWLEKQVAKVVAESKTKGGEHHLKFWSMGLEVFTSQPLSIYKCVGCGETFITPAHRALLRSDFEE